MLFVPLPFMGGFPVNWLPYLLRTGRSDCALRFMEGEAESAMNLRIMCQEQEGMILDLIRERQELVTKRQPDNN